MSWYGNNRDHGLRAWLTQGIVMKLLLIGATTMLEVWSFKEKTEHSSLFRKH